MRAEIAGHDIVARMAKIVQTQLVDDLDGSEAVENVPFGVDGQDYEIDLSEVHAKELRDALSVYTSCARKAVVAAGGSRKARKSAAGTVDREQSQAIREWARGQGMKINDRGRISAEIMTAYNAGH